MLPDQPPEPIDETPWRDLEPFAADAVARSLPLSTRFRLQPLVTPVQRAFLERHGLLTTADQHHKDCLAGHGGPGKKTAFELLDEFGLDDDRAAHALVHGWFDRSSVIEILCTAIDDDGSLDDFEEFLKDNFPGEEPSSSPA